ncbi:hypothetical protein C2G38_2048063 [Gigaspora rosea]|uniref:Isochorismatase-like protein n=1 Tax=Gigaspora rosea TaxID=44941 RepID=A0A397U3L7_9GLOM|nr:hypothetical protein C2G38_2048063 [Gigaspora rosea]
MSTSIPYDPEKAALLVIDMQWKNKDKMIMRGSEKCKFLKELDSIVTRSLTSIGTLDFIIQRAFDENYDIVFIEDATASDTQEMHEATLLNIGYGYGIVTTVKNTIEWLSR